MNGRLRRPSRRCRRRTWRSSSVPSSPGIRATSTPWLQIPRRTSCGISHALTNWPEQDTYSGLLELRAFWDLWLGTWGDHHLELLALVAKDDKVFCRYRQTATGKASQASVEVENGQVITFRDGKVIRTDVYSDPPRRLRLPGSGCSAYRSGRKSGVRGWLPLCMESSSARSATRTSEPVLLGRDSATLAQSTRCNACATRAERVGRAA